MTTTVDIRNAIVAKLNAIVGIGKVHGYERFAVQQSKLKELFEYRSRILGWVVRRSGLKKNSIADAVFKVRSNWEINGYMSLDDADETEILFDALIDLVQLTLSNDPTFGGIADHVPDYELKVSTEPVMFCGVLCHSVTINFDTVHDEISSIESSLNDFMMLNSQYDIGKIDSPAEHAKWLNEPPNHSSSKPELIDNLNPQE